jgi:glyoxylase-like metal-dependent hydrolase (beta-lactamase superfamily II)
MSTDQYHFRIGSFDCIAVSDGDIPGDDVAHMLFKNAPSDLLEHAIYEDNDQIQNWIEVFTPLIIRTKEHLVLIDTGIGVIEGMPNTGKLLRNLQSESIEPGDIDTVIITHAHGDHVGGNTNPAGEPTFSNARYYIRREEWEFWTSEKTKMDPELSWNSIFIANNLQPIYKQIKFITNDNAIVPGIRSIFAPGHTPGNIALTIESEGENLMYLGDAVLHPIHVEHPDWYSEPDILPKQTINSRRMLLSLADKNHSLCIAYHFDYPGLGYIEKYKEGWKWKPLEIS